MKLDFKKVFTGILLLLVCGLYAQDEEKVSNLRIDLSGGYGYRLGKVSDQLSNEEKEYIKDLQNGFSFDLHAGYFIKEDWGLGVYYNQFSSKNSRIMRETVNNALVQVNDNLKISFIGVLSLCVV